MGIVYRVFDTKIQKTADKPKQALGALLAHASWLEKKSSDERLQYVADNLLSDEHWIRTYQSLIEVCKRLKRPRKQWYLLQSQLVRLDTATT